MYLTTEFFDGAYEALRETLRVESAMKREMIQFLQDEGFWDHDVKWTSAEARFNACVSRTKGEFFKISELWALMKRFGRHHLFLAMAEDLGYEVRRRTDLERVQLLLEEVLEKLDERDASTASLRALLQNTVADNIGGATSAGRANRAKFSRAADAVYQ